MNLTGGTIVWCVVQVSLFLALAAPVYLAVRRRNPRAGKLAAACSLTLVLGLTAIAASPWPRWSLGETAARGTATAPATTAPSAQAASAPGDSAATASAPAAASPTVLQAAWAALKDFQPGATAPGAESQSESRWPTALLLVLAAGATLGLVHLLLGLAAVRRLVRRSSPLDDAATACQLQEMQASLGVCRPVRLRICPDIATPATVGWRRPIILLPEAWRRWQAGEQRAVLAHELSHVAEYDFAAWLVARAAIVVHFYHPLVRWFARRLQLDQELAADASAVRLVGDRLAYLHALANLALATPPHRLAGPARTFIPSRSLLVRRVEMLRSSDIPSARESP